MSQLNDTNLIFRALIVLGIVGFGFYLTAERGLLSLALTSDRSYISYVILGLYALATAHWLWLSHALTQERKHFAALETELQADEADLGRLQQGLIGQFLRNWQAKGARGSPDALLTAFGDELVNRHALGHFASDALLKLGLLGTIVGFILMLIPVGEVAEFDPSVMRQLLSAMSGGMAVALYTTLAGLVTSTLLKLQYHILDASAAELATSLAVLTDLHLTHDAT
jgi:hypothetical protein